VQSIHHNIAKKHLLGFDLVNLSNKHNFF